MTGPLRRLAAGRERALAVIGFWLVVAIIGPMLTPYDTGQVVSGTVFAGASRAHPLGTDYLGRDTLARLLDGTRHTVLLCLASTLLSCLAGAFVGIATVISRPWLEMLAGRLVDGLLSIPSLLLALLVIAAFGSSVPTLILTMAVIYMPGAYRTSRALAQRIARLDFVTVARARGEGRAYIILHEILPNMAGPMLADVGLRFIYAVLLLSNLSFLGIGVQPPGVDLGSMVRENLLGVVYGAYAMIAPTLAIAVLTIGINLALDSTGRRR